ncbi:hypothetical protein [Bacillus chungangensis]
MWRQVIGCISIHWKLSFLLPKHRLFQAKIPHVEIAANMGMKA